MSIVQVNELYSNKMRLPFHNHLHNFVYEVVLTTNIYRNGCLEMSTAVAKVDHFHRIVTATLSQVLLHPELASNADNAVNTAI